MSETGRTNLGGKIYRAYISQDAAEKHWVSISFNSYIQVVVMLYMIIRNWAVGLLREVGWP